MSWTGGEFYHTLPENRKDKVDGLRFDKDKKLICGAYLLLKKMLNGENLNSKQENMEK